MAMLISGDREVLNQMIFGPPASSVINYINETNNYFSNILTEAGRSFVDTTNTIFARMSADEASQLAKAALRVVNSYAQHDIISQPRTIDDLQAAPKSMLRWIMCHPQLRQLYKDNRIDGYGDRYIDVSVNPNNTSGWVDMDYQHVYGGWMNTVTEKVIVDGEEVEEEYDEWVIPLMDEDEEVPIDDVECAAILSAHQLVDIALAERRDPTSYYDSDIV